MKFRTQTRTKAGTLPADGWREIEAEDMQAAAVAHLRTLHPVREDYPITVYVCKVYTAGDLHVYPNGTPIEVHGYRFEAVPPKKTTPAPTADDIKHELKDARYADGRNAWESAAAMTADVSAELRRRGIPHSPAQYDAGSNCLTCGEGGRCPGVHTFEEIQTASRAQKGNTP